jgi:hypothetical protein
LSNDFYSFFPQCFSMFFYVFPSTIKKAFIFHWIFSSTPETSWFYSFLIEIFYHIKCALLFYKTLYSMPYLFKTMYFYRYCCVVHQKDETIDFAHTQDKK